MPQLVATPKGWICRLWGGDLQHLQQIRPGTMIGKFPGSSPRWMCAEGVVCAAQEQCKVMTDKHHVYMTSDGRISLAGLPSSKAEYLAKAINDCVRNH